MKSPENRALRNKGVNNYAMKEECTRHTTRTDLLQRLRVHSGHNSSPAKNILGHYFCNHRNVWNVKTSRLDQQQDTQKRESGNQIKHN